MLKAVALLVLVVSGSASDTPRGDMPDDDPQTQYSQEKTEINSAYPAIVLTSAPLYLVLIAVYALKDLRKIYGYQFCVVFSFLFLVHLLSAIIQLGSWDPDSCDFLAHFYQFIYFAAFLWLMVLCIDMYRTFSVYDYWRLSLLDRFCQVFAYSLFVSIVNFIALLITMVMGYHDSGLPNDSAYRAEIDPNTCFFTSPMAVGIYFYFPVSLMLMVTMGIYSPVTMRMCQIMRKTPLFETVEVVQQDIKDTKRYLGFWKLFLIMAFCWVAGITWLWWKSDNNYWAIADVVNIVQSLFMFIFFICKRSVFKIVKKAIEDRKNSRNPVRTPAGVAYSATASTPNPS